jgi:hypothetical protein
MSNAERPLFGGLLGVSSARYGSSLCENAFVVAGNQIK